MSKRRLVVCETFAAITLHLRELMPGEEPCYSGCKRHDAKTLCGVHIGWDTMIQPDQARCSSCIKIRDENDGGGEGIQDQAET